MAETEQALSIAERIQADRDACLADRQRLAAKLAEVEDERDQLRGAIALADRCAIANLRGIAARGIQEAMACATEATDTILEYAKLRGITETAGVELLQAVKDEAEECPMHPVPGKPCQVPSQHGKARGETGCIWCGGEID